MSKTKKPRQRSVSGAAKVAKSSGVVDSTQGESPFFCFRYVDRAAHPDWRYELDAPAAKDVMDLMCEVGGKSWREIEAMRADGHRRHHSHDVTDICNDAQADLARSRLSETFGDTIFGFRLDGRKRLWGFRQGRVFHVVWWDPMHKVYEVSKRHT